MISHQAPADTAASGIVRLLGSIRRLDQTWQRPVRSLKHGALHRHSALSRPELKSLLKQIHEDLGGVSSSTEGVFLLVGERLMELQLRTREIAGQTSAIAELLLHETDSLGVLDEVLAAACANQQGDDTAGAIRGIQSNATSLFSAVQGIGPVVRTFDVLGVMTRIESARVEGEGASFVSLAIAVASLSQQIRVQIGTTADSATMLLRTTSKAAEQMREVAQKQRENLGPLARQTSAELQKMKEHRSQVSEATKRLAARFDEILRSIGDVVTALQAHDIVRQQVDHVLEALPRPDSPDSNLMEIARLQAAQLDNSRTTFEASVRQIHEALAQIERNIEEVAEESARLLGLSGTAGASFFSSVQAELAGIFAILDSNVAGDGRLAEAAVSVHQRVGEISQTISGVLVIGLQMQRIALNATIQAAQLGPDGAALEIIADAIRALARQTETAAGTFESGLMSLKDGALALGASTAARTGSEVQIAHLRQSIDALSSIQDQARGDYSGTLEAAAGMKRQIRETIDAFGTQEGCLQVLATATEMIRQLSIDTRSTESAGAEQLSAIYTMQSERDVHQSLYQPANQVDAFSPAGAAPAEQEENVEFF